VFVLCSPEAACFEYAVENRSPTITRSIALYVKCLDLAVDALSVCVIGHLCPLLHVATEMRVDMDSSSPLVAKYGVQLAEEEFGSRDSEKHVLSLTREEEPIVNARERICLHCT
jgi:hypothetical protein